MSSSGRVSLLLCTENCSLLEFARMHHLPPGSLWLPLRAALPSSASTKANLCVPPSTQILLRETATGVLTLDKRTICTKLQVSNALGCQETSVSIDPRAVPGGYELYVRWNRPGGKRLLANTQLLYYETGETAAASSSASLSGVKRYRSEQDGSTDTVTLAESVRGRESRRSLAQRSSDDFHQRFNAVIATSATPLHKNSLRILQTTLAHMCHRLRQPPLHFVLPCEASVLDAAGVRWARPSRRILTRVFRGVDSVERSEFSKYSDGSRRLRFYFIEDVLLRRPSRWKTPRTSGSNVEAASPARDDEEVRASERVDLLLEDCLLADMSDYAERGYRIVLMEHYPELHHGSRYTVEETLSPVVRLCRERCPRLTVTVVLSVMSWVTATRTQGMELSFVLPYAGLMHFFVSELNTSLQPDSQSVAIVGSCDRGSVYLNGLHSDFARNASLSFVDVKKLR